MLAVFEHEGEEYTITEPVDGVHWFCAVFLLLELPLVTDKVHTHTHTHTPRHVTLFIVRFCAVFLLLFIVPHAALPMYTVAFRGTEISFGNLLGWICPTSYLTYAIRTIEDVRVLSIVSLNTNKSSSSTSSSTWSFERFEH